MVELPPLQPQQPPPERQQPGRHAQPSPQSYLSPQSYPPPHYSYPPPQYPYPPPQQPPPPPPRPKWPLIAGVAVLLVIFIAALVNQGNGSAPVTAGNVPQTTTIDEFAPTTEAPLPVTTEAPPPTPAPTRAPPTPPPALAPTRAPVVRAPTHAPVVEAPTDNGWADVTVIGCSTHSDEFGTFTQADVRITNHASRAESYIVTVGLNNANGERIGEALAVSTDLPSGRIVTVTGHGMTNTPGSAGMRCELANVLRDP